MDNFEQFIMKEFFKIPTTNLDTYKAEIISCDLLNGAGINTLREVRDRTRQFLHDLEECIEEYGQ